MGEPVSGPFSGLIPGTGRKAPQPFRIAGSGYGFGIGSGAGSSSGSKVKKEPAIKTDPSRSNDPDIKMLFAGGEDVNHEDQDGGYISSDPDEATYGRRVDIDQIDLTVSDDEATATEGEASGEATFRRRLQTPGLFPVRVPRVEHQERILGINTESSTSVKAEEAQTQEDRAQTDRGVVSDVRRGKARARDIEVLRSERRWKGVYEEDNYGHTKDEPTEGPNLEDIPLADDVPPVPTNEPPASPEKRARIRNRNKPQDAFAPELTKEEREEESRREFEIDALREEIGKINLPGAAPAKDASDDTEMKDAVKLEKDDHKQDVVYLFQFPPVLPELVLASEAVKNEQEGPALDTIPEPMDVDRDKSGPSASTKAPPVKVENIPNGDDKKKEKIKLDPDRFLPKNASGAAGKLRIHESGKATLSWGGMSFTLSMGMQASFLQESLCTRVEDGEVDNKGGQQIRGEAMNFGPVRGKFVVVPDWDEILR